MKRLFSPWRSAYIQSFKSGPRAPGCLFCRIARSRSDAKNLVVYRGEEAFVVLNLYPYNSGHMMIVPYRHTGDLGNLTPAEHSEIMSLAARCMNWLSRVSKPQGFNFGANLGRAAGAGIDQHIHFHVVPRWSGDTNFMPVLGETKLISEDLKKTWRELRRAVNSQS
jgi:ATP adenylyltransferase